MAVRMKAIANSLLKKAQGMLGYPVGCLYYPSFIQFDITTKCNLDCVGCPRDNIKETSVINTDLSVETFRKAISIFPFVNSVWLHSYGEPLMHNDFFEFVRLAKSAGVKTYFYSNGMLWNREKAKKIVKLGADKVVFSVDATEKKMLERIRRGANFERIIGTIKTLQETKEEMSSSLPEIELCMTLRKENLSELPKMPAFAKKLGIRTVFCQNILTYTKDGEESSLYKADKESALSVFDEAMENAKKEGISMRLPGLELKRGKKCEFPSSMMHVRVDGKVSACPYCAYPFKLQYCISGGKLVNMETDFAEHIVGDLNKDSLETIWKGKKFTALRKTFRGNCLEKPHSQCIVPYGIH